VDEVGVLGRVDEVGVLGRADEVGVLRRVDDEGVLGREEVGVFVRVIIRLGAFSWRSSSVVVEVEMLEGCFRSQELRVVDVAILFVVVVPIVLFSCPTTR